MTEPPLWALPRWRARRTPTSQSAGLWRIAPREAVLDLGSGSGTDSFLAALGAGRGGTVVDVDMTAQQLAKARRLAADTAYARRVPRGPHRASSGRGRIGGPGDQQRRDQPLARQAGGLLGGGPGAAARGGWRIANIVTEHQLPEGITCDAALWAACIGGAMQRERYREAIEAAGFVIERVRENAGYRFVSERAANATRKYGVSSVSLLACLR